MSSERVDITPATRVAELLESWPELEQVLVARAAAFRRLRNPILRRTVARVATLEQAAGVGGVPVRELVAELRRAASLEPDETGFGRAANGGTPADPGAPESRLPDWVDPARIQAVVDADLLLDQGQVPLGRVNALVRTLSPQGIIRVDSGFRPVPLVDALQKQGCRCAERRTESGRFETFFAAPDGGGSVQGRE